MLSIGDIKNLFAQGIQYAKDRYKGVLYDRADDMCEYQLNLANSAQDINTLMNVIWLGNANSTWSSAFKAPKPICTGCELGYTGIQYGTAHVGWYFFYGIAGNISFNLSFFRLEMAPEEVVKKAGIPNYEAVRWNVLGGFGTIGENSEWYSIKPEWIRMTYEQPTYSTFTLSGQGDNISVTLASPIPMNFTITLSYTDMNGKAHTFNASMAAITPPAANVPNTCECGFGLGSFYYSYPLLSLTCTADGGSAQTGSAWIDHQLIKAGVANTLYGQALQTIGGILTKNVTPGWLWTTVQDAQTGIQYMFTHFFGKKFYQDDVKAQTNIPNSMINVYKQGVPYFNPTDSDMDSGDFRMVMTKTVKSESTGLDMPASYDITLPGGKEVVLTIASAPNVYPSAFAPYETPAYLYDKSGNIIGTGLIEANFYFDNTTMVKRLIGMAGGDPTDPKQVSIVLNALTKPQKFYQKLLGVLIVLFPVIAIIIGLVFVLRKDSKPKKYKIGLAVALLLLLYLFLKM